MMMTREVEQTRPRADASALQHTAAIVSQATAVEQARAVAEVQAAVVVAQQVPRDAGRVWADMEHACKRRGLADRAFYSVRNRGTGPSVHLARELARIFGNVQYGVHELRRDDTAGMSEIQAFAWDVEKNVRSTRTFQVPHARMAKGERSPLTDLQDVYLNNQNIGARAVRECIFTVLPADFTDKAQELCHDTIRSGDGTPLADQITALIKGFADEFDVKLPRLEAKIGRPRSGWQPGDVASMRIAWGSLRRGELTIEDAFPQAKVSPAELTGEAIPDAK